MTLVECDNDECKYWIHNDTCTRHRINVRMLYDFTEHKRDPYCYTGLVWLHDKDQSTNLCDSCKFARKNGDWYFCDYNPASSTKYLDVCGIYEMKEHD